MPNPNLHYIHCVDKHDGSIKAYSLLKECIKPNTLLLLSGGSTPIMLYKLIAMDGKLVPEYTTLVDERFGEKFHKNSNEAMMFETGIIEYFKKAGSQYYPILENKSLEKTVADYQEKIIMLLRKSSYSIAIMGIGEDGHTAGILPKYDYDQNQYVIGYEVNDQYQQRITLTFKALDEIDMFLVLAFGKSKMEAIKKMFESTDRSHVPCSYFSNGNKPTFLFTDTKIS